VDDELTARLLRLGGMRPDVPADRERRVRGAFLDEVRATARARVLRRRATAVAAGLALSTPLFIALSVWAPRDVAPLATAVATVERLEGGVARRVGATASAPVGMALGETVYAGDRVESGSSRIAVRLASGASLRFDRGSRARFVSARSLVLDAGAVYVESASASPVIEIATSLGTVRDIGTQFEVRLGDAALRVRVRSGAVEVQRGTAVSSARAGDELTVTAAGAVSRAVSPHGDEWAWTAALGPAFDIEGRSLREFLEHVCREQGWTLTYRDSDLAREAPGIMLHGSTRGLQPSEALAVVMATTGLTHRVKDGKLEVGRADPP
jgi:ferric-dicitrate binding protein FerR (iron transport regulator)